MIPNDYSQEAHQLSLHINQENTGGLVFSVVGHISQVDPTTNNIKVVIPTWTNDQTNFVESGWVPLGTAIAGNQYGIQLLPFGGANVQDPSGQNQNKNAAAEQVLVHVLGRKRGLYVVGVQMFNQVDVPPTGYQDISGVQAQAGEWLWKHASGSYLYMSNVGIVKFEALTNPAPVLQPKDAPDQCQEKMLISAAAYGQNSNSNGDNVTKSQGLLELVADSNGATETTTSTASLQAIQTQPNDQATNNCTAAVTAGPITAGQVGNANLNLTASSTGAQTNNAQFTLSSESQMTGSANGGISVTAEQGDAVQEITVKSQSGAGTLNITIEGTPNTINVFVDGGTVNIQAPTINLGNGTMERVLNHIFTEFFNNHVHSGVQSGSDSSGTPTLQATSAQESQNVYSS